MKIKINNEEYELFTKAITKKDYRRIKKVFRDKDGSIDFSRCIELRKKT